MGSDDDVVDVVVLAVLDDGLGRRADLRDARNLRVVCRRQRLGVVESLLADPPWLMSPLLLIDGCGRNARLLFTVVAEPN